MGCKRGWYTDKEGRKRRLAGGMKRMPLGPGGDPFVVRRIDGREYELQSRFRAADEAAAEREARAFRRIGAKVRKVFNKADGHWEVFVEADKLWGRR